MEAYEEKQFMEKWEKQRAKGKWLVVLQSAGGFALLFGTLLVLLDLFEVDLATAVNRNLLSVRKLVVIAAMGILSGMLNWWLMERMYRRIKSGG